MNEGTSIDAPLDPYEAAERDAMAAIEVVKVVVSGASTASVRRALDEALGEAGALSDSGVGRRTTQRLREIAATLDDGVAALTLSLEAVHRELYDETTRAATWSEGLDAAAQTIEGVVAELVVAYAEHLDICRSKVGPRLAAIAEEIDDVMRRAAAVDPDDLRSSLVTTARRLLAGIESMCAGIAQSVRDVGPSAVIDSDGALAARLTDALAAIQQDVALHLAGLVDPAAEDQPDGRELGAAVDDDHAEMWAAAAAVLDCEPSTARRIVTQLARAPVSDESSTGVEGDPAVEDGGFDERGSFTWDDLYAANAINLDEAEGVEIGLFVGESGGFQVVRVGTTVHTVAARQVAARADGTVEVNRGHGDTRGRLEVRGFRGDEPALQAMFARLSAYRSFEITFDGTVASEEDLYAGLRAIGSSDGLEDVGDLVQGALDMAPPGESDQKALDIDADDVSWTEVEETKP